MRAASFREAAASFSRTTARQQSQQNSREWPKTETWQPVMERHSTRLAPPSLWPLSPVFSTPDEFLRSHRQSTLPWRDKFYALAWTTPEKSMVHGEAGSDWFFYTASGANKDKLNDLVTGEVATAL